MPRPKFERHTWRAGGVARNTALNAISQFVRFGVAFVMLPLLIDNLGADRTGLLTFAITLTGYFTAVELSLATSLTKYVPEFRSTGEIEQLNSFLRGNFLLMSAVGVFVALVLGALGLFGATALFGEASLQNEAAPTIYVAALTALFYWPTRIGPAALQGLERYDVAAIIAILASVVTLAGVFALTRETQSVPVFAGFVGGVFILQNVVSGAFAWPHLEIRRRVGRWLSRAHLHEILGFGGALFIIGIADTLVYSFDRTILAAFVGAAAIVVYEVAVRLQSAVRTVATLAGGALLSTASRLIAQGRAERLRELVLIGSFLSVMITTPVAILLMILAEPTIAVWVGHDYVQYAGYAQIFISIWIVAGNMGVLGAAITGTGRLGLFALLAIVNAAVSLVLSVALTAVWGTIGVILGTVIPTFIGLPIWMYFAFRRVDVPIRQYVSYVVVPAYSFIAIWSGLVLILNSVFSPRTFGGLAVFTILTVLVFWLAAFRMTRTRWRRAARGRLVPGSA